MAKWQGNMPEWMRKEMQERYDQLKSVNPAIVRGTLKREFGDNNADEFLRNNVHHLSRTGALDTQDRRARLHRALDYVMDRAAGRDAAEDWEVVVGNIGSVYRGSSKLQAESKFKTYVEQSKLNYGRAANEDVTILHNGEPVKEFAGSREDE